MNPLRVGVVTPYGGVAGGAEAWLLDVIDHALNPAHGAELSAVVMAEGPMTDALRDRGVSVELLNTGPSPVDIARAAPRLRRILRAADPDVVVANGVKAALAVALARAGVPTVWIKHDHSFDAVLARPLGRAFTTVIATAVEVGLPTHRRDLLVIEPPRPPEPRPAAEAHDRLAALGLVDSGRLTLAMVSRLVPYKGIDVAVKALALPGAEDWQLVVMGGPDPSAPDERERLQQQARERGVAHRMHLLGPVPSAGSLLTGTDALAVLTRPDGWRNPSKEGYGMVATEAMLCGIPVIAAGQGPIATRLATPLGPAGIVVPQADPSAVASALGLLRDPDLRAGLGKLGRAVSEGLPDRAAVGGMVLAGLREAADAR